MKKTGNKEVSRKVFLKQSALTVLGLGLFSDSSFSKEVIANEVPDLEMADENKVRSIAYNVFNGCIGYKGINSHALPEGEVSDLIKFARKLNQIPQRIMLELALYQPNIISFSEGPSEEVLAKMAAMIGYNYTFFPGAIDGKGKFPGAVLTNYEILSSESRPFVDKENNNPKELFTRHWGKAKLRLPSGKTLIVHSAHLWPFKKSEKDTEIRMAEIIELHKAINQDLKQTNSSVLLQGDLNQVPDTPEYQALQSGKLVDTFVQAGVGDSQTTSSKNSRRIDYIFAGGEIAKHIQSCRSLFQGNFRMNREDPMSFALSDHMPVMADFEF